jgi:hypothetical protein
MPLVPLAPYKTPRRAAAAQVAQLYNIPAPVGGLNFRDPIAAMPPTDALILDNFIPRQLGVELRRGYKVHTNTVGFPIGSVFAYNAPDPDDSKIFAAANGDIYDCTVEPAVLDESATGSTDNIWWTTQFSTGADTFLLAVSPSAGYWTYSTTTGWVKRTPTNLPSNPRTVGVWKRRIFFTCENDDNIYYMTAVNAITGTVTAFPMGAHLSRGGYVSAVANWTLDAGVGIDDYLVVIGTQGDVMIWQGIDPSVSTDFSLRGIWYVGPVPKYGRYFTPMGGDMMVLSELGLVPLSRLVNGQFVEGQPGPSAKIQQVLAPEIRTLLLEESWDVFSVPSEDLLILKLPEYVGVYKQYAMNITTGAWCTLSGLPMACATILAGSLYIGTDAGLVCRAFFGEQDNVLVDGTDGTPVEGEIQTAFQTFGSPGINKKFDLARPIFIAPSPPSVKVRLNTQYTFGQIAGSPSYSEEDIARWDQSIWNTARWVGDANTYQSWVGITGLGYYGSLRMRLRGQPETIFTSAHIMATTGGMM